MFAKIARAAFLLIVAVMIVSWALSVSNGNAVEPEPKLPTDRMYS